MDELKYEMALLANNIINNSKLSYRDLSKKSDSINISLLSRVANYDIDNITVERLIGLLFGLKACLGIDSEVLTISLSGHDNIETNLLTI